MHVCSMTDGPITTTPAKLDDKCITTSYACHVPMQPLEHGTRMAGGRSRSLPRSWTRRGITDGADRERAAGVGEQGGGGGEGGGRGGGGGEGGGGGRGGRLRGLVARAGRQLDAALQMVADGEGVGCGKKGGGGG